MNIPEFVAKWKSSTLTERATLIELAQKRRVWLDPPGATDAELKKRTLTNLYNERNARYSDNRNPPNSIPAPHFAAARQSSP
ncbi:MAG TPA: hypothetical protein VFP05_13075 [Thermomicrobiales bacterium]|nr:hypothetical protein [Thermomicrobiales bacterium]